VKVHPIILLLGLGMVCTFGINIPLSTTTAVRFADERRAATELSTVDNFIKSLSPFDRAARLQTDKAVAQDEFLKFVSAQALPWNSEETNRLALIISSIGNKLAPFALKFPETILLVKTTGKEEGNAAYCRNTNVIVLPQSKIPEATSKLEGLLIHELFHILSRNNPKLRDSLYALVGYKPCSVIELPETLKSRKITNPDAPIIEHYIGVEVGGKAVLAAPVLYSSQPHYDAASGKSFFAYLTFRLLVIEREGEQWRPKHLGNRPWLLDASETKGFHEQIGRNTGYIIHPEEVLADNFVLLVNGKRDLPSPEIIEKMKGLLLNFP